MPYLMQEMRPKQVIFAAIKIGSHAFVYSDYTSLEAGKWNVINFIPVTLNERNNRDFYP